MLCTVTTPAVLRQLRVLVTIGLDSAQGLSRAAECAKSQALARTLRACAVTREEFAAELRDLLRAVGDSDAVPTAGRATRWWIDLQSIAERGGDRGVLNEALRAEAVVREAYHNALLESELDELSDVIQRQAESVRRVEQHLRLLREVPRFI